uniref:Uncharacterized protein n=1 Tax=Lepeophtheirus salmonis TaxID=72036 RepID=A0A0K2UCC8_LEPSM
MSKLYYCTIFCCSLLSFGKRVSLLVINVHLISISF